MATREAEARLDELWKTPHTFWGWLTTVDHKKIGTRYIVTAIIFLLIGGVEALIIRTQLARPNESLLTPEAYNQVFTMHGMTMIFWYAAPILSGFSNYLIPLLIGSRDMAFPRLNAFSYWVFVLSGIFVYCSLIGFNAPHDGWFAYAPYNEGRYSPGHGMDFYALSLIFLTISQTVGSINFLVTIFRMRAPGMSINRMPLLAYSTSTMSALSVVALPSLTAACVFLVLDRNWQTHFFQSAAGGSPLLWQQLFWFFGHPWVYIVFLPATGMVSMIIPVFSRRPIVGYVYVAIATVLTGVVGMGVWMHHMFAVGSPQMAMNFFSAASMTISIFTIVQIFAWVATMWHGRPVVSSAMLFAIGFMMLIVIGGLDGVVTAVIPFDWQIHDTYWVVGHLHYVLVGANLFPVFAALYYWYPKMTGRMLNERLGKTSFWLMFAGLNAVFFPMHLLGLAGMTRRIYTYLSDVPWGGLNMVETIGAYVLAFGILLSVWNFLASRKTGRLAGPNPWNADTLEWSMSSPPPEYAFLHIPTIETRHPLWDDHDEYEDPNDELLLDQGARLTPATTWLDARLVGVAVMPEDSIMPLALALALTGLFTAVLLKAILAAAIVAGICALCAAIWLWPERTKKRLEERFA